MSSAHRLTFLAWAHLAGTVWYVVSGVLAMRVLIEGGAVMACFDGERQACAARPVALVDQWRSLAVGAILVGTAAAAVLVANRHRHSRARRRTAIAMLGASATLNGIAALAFLTL